MNTARTETDQQPAAAQVRDTGIPKPRLDIGDLKGIYLLEGLSDDQLRAVINTAHVLGLKEGDFLFDFGQPASRYFFLRSGQIKLFRTS